MIGNAHRIARGIRTWLGYVLVVAFALRALVPAGWMPDFAGVRGDGIAITICTGTGTVAAVLDDDGNPIPQVPGAHDGAVSCALTGLSGVMAPADVPVLVAAARFERPVAWRAGSTGVALERTSGPALGSRGPPSLS